MLEYILRIFYSQMIDMRCLRERLYLLHLSLNVFLQNNTLWHELGFRLAYICCWCVEPRLEFALTRIIMEGNHFSNMHLDYIFDSSCVKNDLLRHIYIWLEKAKKKSERNGTSFIYICIYIHISTTHSMFQKDLNIDVKL